MKIYQSGCDTTIPVVATAFFRPPEFSLCLQINSRSGLQKSGMIQYRDAAVFLVMPGSSD
jgi:hypothetical protein